MGERYHLPFQGALDNLLRRVVEAGDNMGIVLLINVRRNVTLFESIGR